MDVVNIEAVNTAAFVFSRMLSPWAQAYNLPAATFRAYMRLTIADPVVQYAWASDGSCRGSITFSATAANGNLAYTANPAPGDTIQLGSTIVTFISGTPAGNQVLIGDTLAGTMANLVAVLTASTDAQIDQCSYSVSGYTLGIIFKLTTAVGNSFVLAASSAGVTVSGPTLWGAGGMVTFTCPTIDLVNFSGDYVYDCRLELGGINVAMFGGTITFLQGVTR